MKMANMRILFRGGELIGLSPNIRVYRYKKGQYFDCHCEFLAGSVLLGLLFC